MKTVFQLILYCTLIITSCTSPRYIDIQVLNPAEVKLPHNLEKVFIASKTKFANDSAGNKYNFFLKGFYDNLKKNLQESPLFEGCIFYVCSSDSMINVFKKISYNERKRCALFTIDSLALEDSLYFVDLENYFFAHAITYDMKFNVAGRFTKLTFAENPTYISQKDTLFWGFDDYYEYQVHFHNKNLAFQTGGLKIGEMFAHRMAPYWTTEERVLFYNNNKLIRKAYKAYVNDEIRVAISLWTRLFNVGTNSLASYAAHNIAVCYEMLDDLDLCQEWLVKSIEKHPNYITEKYLVDIKKRRNNLIKLDKQMLL